MNLSKVRTSVHCGSHLSNVKAQVQKVLRTDEDMKHFYEYLQFRNETEPDKTDLCRVDALHKVAESIGCIHCFHRVQNMVMHAFNGSDVVPLEFLGANPLEAIARFVDEPAVQRTNFLVHLHASIDMTTDRCISVGPRYTLSPFLGNLKTMLDQTEGLRSDGRELSALEGITDEQNQYISMMSDCVTEFVAAAFKFETTRPFKKNACVFVQALVTVFEKLCTTLFNTCHKVRERFHRSDVPSLTSINMRRYLDSYKEDVDVAKYKSALLSIHILNLQRIDAFRTFYTEACDQVVSFDAMYTHECSRLWKYVDQEDFIWPYFDTPIKNLLIAQLELGLGPMLARSAEFTQGRYPTVIQELGMLEMRCTKLQQGHLDVWTRTKDRVLEQMVPTGFALTEMIRVDIETASNDAIRMCTNAIEEFTGKMRMSTPVIDRTFHTDPLDGLRQRGIVRIANLRMMCNFSFGLRHLSALAAFLHDYHPAIQERVCGTDYHVQLFVRNAVLEKHIQTLLDNFSEYARQAYMRDIIASAQEPKCVRSATKKSKGPKQKKMEKNTAAALISTTKSSDSELSVLAVTSDHDEDVWEEVRSKKKSTAETIKSNHERSRGKSHTQKKKNQSQKCPTPICNSQRYTYNSPSTVTKRRNDIRASSPNPYRPEPVASEPEPVASEPGSVASEPGSVASEPGSVASEPGSVASEPVVTRSESEGNVASEHPPAVEPPQSKRERRRGRARSQPQMATEYAHVLNHALFASASAAPSVVDPLVLASFAASQVSQPVPMPSHQVAVPARLFGGVLPREYASVPFMTFPRVYI